MSTDPSPVTKLEFRATIVWYLFSTFYALVWIIVTIIVLIGAVGSFSSNFGLAIVLAIGGLALISVWYNDVKLPYKTVFDGQRLITYSISGKRTVELSKIIRAEKVAFLFNSMGSFGYMVKFKDENGGTLYIKGDQISKSKRATLVGIIMPYLNRPGVEVGNGVIGRLMLWSNSGRG